MRTFLLAALAPFALCTPTQADQLLGQPRINGANQVLLPGGPALGTMRNGKLVVDDLNVTMPNGGAALGQIVPSLDLVRSDIPSKVIPLRSFVVSGFAASNDGGAGARYVRGAASGPMAVQDAAGTWWQLDLSAPLTPAGWFGLLASNTGAQNDAASAKAVAALGANGGGVLTFPCANFQFATGVDNNVQGVLFRGPPSPNGGRDSGTFSTCAQFVATQAGSTLFKHRTPYGQGFSKFIGGGFEGIMLNGNNVATRVLDVDTVNNGSYLGFITGSVGREAAWFHTGTSHVDVSDNADIQSARIFLTCRQIDGTAQGAADCYRLDGGSNANFSMNEEVTLKCQFLNGNCITGMNADNNRINLNAYRAGSGTGRAVYGYAANSSTGSVGFDNNFFSHFSSNAPSYLQGLTDTGATGIVKNEIAFLDTANSTPVPTVGKGSAWFGDFLQTYTPTVRCSSGSSTSGAVVGATYINRPKKLSVFVSLAGLPAACPGAAFVGLPYTSSSVWTGTGMLMDRANAVPMSAVVSPGATEVQIAPISGGSIPTSAIIQGNVDYLSGP